MNCRGCTECRTDVSFLCVLWKKGHASFSDAYDALYNRSEIRDNGGVVERSYGVVG
jgi:hypothetical protein